MYQWGIDTLENQISQSGNLTAESPVYGARGLFDALLSISSLRPTSVADILAEIGLLLARSCTSLRLALPRALAVQSERLRQHRKPESISLMRDSLALLKEWRQTAPFFRKHQRFCDLRWISTDLHVSTDGSTSALLDDMQSAYLAGIETKRRILDNLPQHCVSPLVRELQDYSGYLQLLERDEEACDVLADAIQAAKECPCDSDCIYDPANPDGLFCGLMESYLHSLIGTSRVGNALKHYKVAFDAAPCDEYFLNEYSDALLGAGRTEESYDVLHKYVEGATLGLSQNPTQGVSYELAKIAKKLSSHPHISSNYNLQLHLLSNILSWLRTDYAEDSSDDEVARLEREVLWDYANVLAILNRFEASEEAFAELVQLWRTVYKLEWDNGQPPLLVNEWYFVALDMYAKLLAVNGKASESQATRDIADSLLVQHSFSVPDCASKLNRPSWKVEYNSDDPDYPPQLIYLGSSSWSARPAALLPNGRVLQTVQNPSTTSDLI